MKNKVWWLVGVVVVIIIAVLISVNQKPKTMGTIKIGLSLPLSGDLAFIGETDRNAALLAIEEVRSTASSSKKQLKYNYELVIEDDGFDSVKGVSVVNKFINIDGVNALISIGSTVGNVVAPIAEAKKVPHIGMASDLNVAKGEYNFIHWTRPQEEVTTMINELKKRGVTKVVVCGLNQQGWLAIVNDFKERASAAGIEILAIETFNPGISDFRTIIAKIEKFKPDIYLFGAFDPEIGMFAKQYRAAGIRTPLTSIETFGLTSDPKPFEGMWFIDAAVPNDSFRNKYVEKFGKEPGPAAANTYDAVKLFVYAFETAPNSSGEQIIKALGSIKSYASSMGELSVEQDGAFISQATVKVIKDGKAVPVQ